MYSEINPDQDIQFCDSEIPTKKNPGSENRRENQEFPLKNKNRREIPIENRQQLPGFGNPDQKNREFPLKIIGKSPLKIVRKSQDLGIPMSGLTSLDNIHSKS